jgi:uroporphyrin-III C-methyltransferase/precorrin-2 dehydrogenase/sirohydrochlorin ferrochelatase
MSMFPVMLCMEGRRCLVVGGGGVALRKVQSLVEEGADIFVVSPRVVEPLEDLRLRGRIRIERREYLPGEAAGYALVFAATDDREVNARVFRDADAAGIWVNVADDPELCSFHLPARLRRNALQIAVASGGEAPFVVRRLRKLLENRLGHEWSEWLDAAQRFRSRVRGLDLTPAEQSVRYDRFFAGTVDPERLIARVPGSEEENAWLEHPVGAEPVRHPRREVAPEQEGRGFVSLVGAGPGCAGLVTIRGRNRMLTADAVVYDRLAAPALPCDLPASVELHPVGKQAGHHPIPQEEINAILVRLARDGKRVVRLKGGDPYVFGRGGEEAEVLESEGIPFEVVPGITSGIAAPAWAGIPVTHRREAVRLTLLTAHESLKEDGPQVRWDLLAKDPHATLVGYMGVTSLPQVVERLLDGGMDPATPAAMVERGTTSSQRSVTSTLAELPDVVVREGLEPPALFVIGPTVRHTDRLSWFEQLPLYGQRLVVPSSAGEVVTALEEAGADVLAVPNPVTPAARVVMGASALTGCVFRSPADVESLEDEREQPGWDGDMTAWCIGRDTAERARKLGWARIREIEDGLAPRELALQIGDR